MTSIYTNRQWQLVSRPTGMFSQDNFSQVTEQIDTLNDGQVLVETNYLSFDPTQRIWAIIDSYVPKIPLNSVMRAFGIGQVVESKNSKFKVGDFVYGNLGWQDYKLYDPQEKDFAKPQIIPGFLDPVMVAALSITGVTAWLGMHKIAKVNAKDTVLVSGAAGAVGSMACQIAKLKGATVIGIAGGKKKCQFLLDDLGVDRAIDYQSGDLVKQIKDAVGDGIDIYFDNVGGETLEIALTHLNKFARVILCGAISQYNLLTEESIAKAEAPGTKNIFNLIAQSASMHGFVILDYMRDLPKALMTLYHWQNSGKIKQLIDMQEGFDNIPQTLQRLFEGKNIGKQLLTIRHPSRPRNSNWMVENLFKLSRFIYS
ncbi:NADP-dependent oxidoreductase [Legionella sp. W05-934-2]|jgi:NADPH-dependent curcumin reductase CurA|uniref:NADP-dependent oxidoreductase n=1 Tax=Legionella sp. W05-934-2 TaxID=1198649 RepID=UPI003461B26E